MSLSPGTTLGRYEIIEPVGEGGIGKVYRARDSRIRREVAVKVLRASYATNPDWLRRFEHEARAAGSLNHPNILAVYDVGTHEGAPFLVTELLEGETLRARLSGGPLPIRRAVEIAREIALGLAAAHARGIVHRDLKPENIFLTRDQRVKILDFGIAKLTPAPVDKEAITAQITSPGVILGTVGYMAPEQVRGEPVSARADLFALGCILHEMLVGTPPFQGPGPVEVLHAVLQEDPVSLSDARPEVPQALAGIVQHCLEKDPNQRFQSAHDVAFALSTLAGTTAVKTLAVPTPWWRRRPVVWTGGALVLGLVAAPLLWSLFGSRGPSQPSFERLTFRRGSLSSARFSPDGGTIVYSAAWDGDPTRVFSTRLDSRESSPLPIPDARLLSVSSGGDLAITLGPGTSFAAGEHTVLATVPLAGGAPREVAEQVAAADWSPSGRELAVVHEYVDRMSLEYPAGKEIWKSATGITSPRVSPDGALVACIETDTRSDFNRGYVTVVDRSGKTRRLTPMWESIQGIAWAPRGDEIWFTAVHQGSAKELWAVSLRGRERLLLRVPGGITLLDVSRNGNALVSQDNFRLSLLAVAPGETRERDLSWQDVTGVADLSADGRTLIFTEYSEAYGQEPALGMRNTDGSPVVHLGDGYAGGLSPDGKWVVAIVYGSRHHLSIFPTGPGQVHELDPGPVTDFDWSCWAPDGRVIFAGVEPGHRDRAYVQDIAGGAARPITPEGIPGLWRMVSPDGKDLMATTGDSLVLYPLDGGVAKPMGAMHWTSVIGWLPDGRSLLVSGPRNILPVHVERLNLATGERHRIRDLMPQDPAGVTEIIQIIFTPNLRAWAYSYRRVLSDLYLVKGLR